MDKKTIRLISIALVIAITILVIALVAKKIRRDNYFRSMGQKLQQVQPGQGVPVQQKGQAVPVSGTQSGNQVQTDSDVKGIESDLNSVNDGDFSEGGLSDTNVGL